jgi:hypothetical protein
VVSIASELKQVDVMTVQTVRTTFNGSLRLEQIHQPKRLGYFELKVSAQDQLLIQSQGSRPHGFIPWIVVPQPDLRPHLSAEQAKIGMQGGFNPASEIRQLLGIRWQLGHLGWHRTEPTHAQAWPLQGSSSPIAFNKSSLIKTRHGSWQTYLLPSLIEAKLPDWVRQKGTEGSICKEFGALNDAGTARFPGMVSSAVSQFHADHKAVEIPLVQVTWEPANDWCFRGSSPQLVEMYRLARQGVKSSGVRAELGGPTLFSTLDPGNQSQIQDLLQAGLAQHLDALSIHPYTKPHEMPGEFLLGLRSQWWNFNTAASRLLPLWATEQGFRDDQGGGPLNTARYNIQQTISLLGEGSRLVLAFYAHDFRPSPAAALEPYGYFYNLSSGISFGSSELAPKPAAAAFAAMTFQLEGANSEGPRDLTNGVTAYLFQRQARQTLTVSNFTHARTHPTSSHQNVSTAWIQIIL